MLIFKNIYHVNHYGASRSLDDYLQESGRIDRDGRQAFLRSTAWRLAETPVKKNRSLYCNREVAAMLPQHAIRRYLENFGTYHMCC